MTKYVVTHDSVTVREYEVEAETPDQAVALVKGGDAKLVDSSSAETHRAREHRAREHRAMGAGAILGAGLGGAFRSAAQKENVAQAIASSGV